MQADFITKERKWSVKEAEWLYCEEYEKVVNQWNVAGKEKKMNLDQQLKEMEVR